MPIDEEDLREILRLFPIYQTRLIIEERETGVKSRDQEELIDALVAEKWTEDEYQTLIERLQTIKEEGRPLGYYICQIEDSPSMEDIEQELHQDEAKFDEQKRLLKGGYEIHHVSESELKATRWKVKTEREFNFRTGEVEKNEVTLPVEFTVDQNKERVYIDTSQYGKARSIKTKLEKSGFTFRDIGHRNMEHEEANKQVKQFVDALEEKVD
jgi:hypothetical protein